MIEVIRSSINRDNFRKNFNKYTCKAFKTLPAITKPKILDIGCGSGVGTIEIARLSDGDIVAIDIDEKSLKVFKEKIVELSLMHQIKILKCSIHEMTFSNRSFDIIWMEGLQFIDFKTRLKLCYPLLKPDGFLVIHEGPENTEIKIKSSFKLGFQLFSRFNLPDSAWWDEYYYPLEKKLEEQLEYFKDDLKKIGSYNSIIKEIVFAKKNPEKTRSLFMIFQKF